MTAQHRRPVRRLVRHPGRHGRQRGFTLLELLVAMTLLSLLSVMMYGGLDFGVRVWERHGAEQVRQSDVLTVQEVLRREISQASTLFYRGDRQQTAVAFSGADDLLTFVGPVPAAFASGGNHVIGLMAEDSGGTRNLVLKWERFLPERRGMTLAQGAATEVLMENIEGLRFSYFGRPARQAPPVWSGRWQRRDALPQLIRIEIAFAEGDPRVWPDFVAAVMTRRLQR